ncbi:MAG: (5-formylfuran-3-yl)methyl phosphate synthase [Methyloglobulus sp.]|nr:hypothetical protein [Methyloglobulus sp.]
MTGMLASVNSLEEAEQVLAEDVDIIDLKEPSRGALGGLDIALVKIIVQAVNGRCPVSATIGDLPMQPELVFNAVKAMAETGVNYVKIGLFPSGNQKQVIEKLAEISSGIKLIAVLFADMPLDFKLIALLKEAGFSGVMLDTANKANGSLTQIMAKTEIEVFVSQAKALRLLCGLAGSLRLADIPLLASYYPDYLGFRGALCLQQDRVGGLNRQAVQTIKNVIIELS